MGIEEFKNRFFIRIILYVIISALIAGICHFFLCNCCVNERVYSDILISLITFLGVLFGSIIVALSVAVRRFQEKYDKADNNYKALEKRQTTDEIKQEMDEIKQEMKKINEYWEKYYIKDFSYILYTLFALIFLFIIFLLFRCIYFLSFSFIISMCITYYSIDILMNDIFGNPFQKK